MFIIHFHSIKIFILSVHSTDVVFQMKFLTESPTWAIGTGVVHTFMLGLNVPHHAVPGGEVFVTICTFVNLLLVNTLNMSPETISSGELHLTNVANV